MTAVASFDIFHTACKKIEVDGTDGFWSCAELVGFPVAINLLIGHLRRSLGAMNSFPADRRIDAEVDEILAKELPFVTQALKDPHALFYMGKYYALDNFSAFAIEWRTELWPTLEHAYQAEKTDDERIRRTIKEALSAHDAKQIGRSVSTSKSLRKDWGGVKKPMMKALMMCKAEQHPYIRKTLVQSKGLILIEDSPTDSFWGRGPDWKGENTVGELWMEIRDSGIMGR